MTTQIRKEQINILRSAWSVINYTGTAGTTSTTITAATLNASSVTGISGGDPSVPTRGIVTTSGGGFSRLRIKDNGISLNDGNLQIFGRLTVSGGNYLVSYKKIVSGSETTATLPGSGSYLIQMLFPEIMNFQEVPANSDILYGSSQELLTNNDNTSTINTSIKTGTYTASIGDLVRCNPSGGGFTINLTTAVGNNNKSIIIKNVTTSTNSIVIDAFGSETIDGQLTKTISIAYQSITLISDNINWIQV